MMCQAPAPPTEPQAVDESQRHLWLAVRRALLLIVSAIEQRYGVR